MTRFFFFLLCIGCVCKATTQKPAIDFPAIDHWPGLPGFGTLSSDGRFCAFYLNNEPAGGRTLVIKATQGAWKREFPAAKRFAFSEDNQHFVFQDASDTLWILETGSENVVKVAQVGMWAISPQGYLGFMVKGANRQLILYALSNGREKRFNNAHGFVFNHKGDAVSIVMPKNTDSGEILTWYDLNSGTQRDIWHGDGVGSVVFSNDDERMVFVESLKRKELPWNDLWYCEKGMESAKLILRSEDVHGKDSGLAISGMTPFFDRTGERIFFSLAKLRTGQSSDTNTGIGVFDYKSPLLPSIDLDVSRRDIDREDFLAVINLKTNFAGGIKYVQVENDSQCVVAETPMNRFVGKYIVVEKYRKLNWQARLKMDSAVIVYRMSIDDGSEVPIRVNTSYSSWRADIRLSLSGDFRYLLWFSEERHNYFSYNVENGKIRNITEKIPVSVFNEVYTQGPGLPSRIPGRVGPWVRGDSAVLIYDGDDIWLVDPDGARIPVNITNGIGRRQNIRFRVVETLGRNVISSDSNLLLVAFNSETKYNGFYRKRINNKDDPKLLCMGPYSFYRGSEQINGSIYSWQPIKARDADVWLLGRTSPTEAPNYYVTSDFKTLTPVSNIRPQAGYNWLTTELVKWLMPDGQISHGLLYKPENFDPRKKYPIIFVFYSRESDGLFDFPEPDYNGSNINIPYYVSRGYLVFTPDIYYTLDQVGNSVLNSVVSAARYLEKTRPWIDRKRMAISAQSYGGYEVNYLITHTHLFAAAAECCGMTDLVSDYGSMANGISQKNTFIPRGYYKMSATLWQRPDIYIKNSPIFRADKITTPLLMLHNHKDYAVLFSQGVELFTALWQMGKPAWLLQYDGEGHGVGRKHNRDFSMRLSQFFDYYLMGKPPPRWMTEEVQPDENGVELGLQIDYSGRKP